MDKGFFLGAVLHAGIATVNSSVPHHVTMKGAIGGVVADNYVRCI